MKVKLLSYLPDEKTFEDLRKRGLSRREWLKHATFTFSIEGASRSCTHQLVRHRMASYLQQSQRFVELGKNSYVTPPRIKANEKSRKMYDGLMGVIWDGYEKLIKAGVPVEDARFVLPNAAVTNITMTASAESLMNFFKLRCCMHAQWEIRELANQMLREVKKVAPFLFADAGPWCKMIGVCPEKDTSCVFYKNRRGKKPIFQSGDEGG